MSRGYTDVLGQFSTLRAASDNMLVVDTMVRRISEAQVVEHLNPSERLEAEVGLLRVLADMVVARRAYRANNSVLATTDALLDRLQGV